MYYPDTGEETGAKNRPFFVLEVSSRGRVKGNQPLAHNLPIIRCFLVMIGGAGSYQDT